MSRPLPLDGEDRARMDLALAAVASAGEGLLALRDDPMLGGVECGDQLKTAYDTAAEAWVLALLRGGFGSDAYVAEETWDGSRVALGAGEFWTVDALDGTRSFVEGFDGFCVQVAFVRDGRPVFGVVREPVRSVTWAGVAGQGAWRLDDGAAPVRLRCPSRWPAHPAFVDSRPPTGRVRALMEARSGHWLECGSFGLKICRAASGEASVFAKAAPFKVWDVAPGIVIAEEAGARIGQWDAAPLELDSVLAGRLLLVAPSALFDEVSAFLAIADEEEC